MRQYLATVFSGIGSIISGVQSKCFARPLHNDAAVCPDVEDFGKLTGVLAHEIKNPLSTIKVNLRLIEENLHDEVRQRGESVNITRALRKTGVVRAEAERLEEILDSFLRYTDQSEPKLDVVNLNEVMSDMVDFFFPQAESHKIKLRQLLCNEELYCKIDEALFKQAVLNIMINSQQAMGGGGELMVRTSAGGGQAKLEISDTGCGIDEDKVGKIFDPYFSMRRDGSGLGLATTRRIVEAHNGSIDVMSDKGKGTSFVISLPLAQRQ